MYGVIKLAVIFGAGLCLYGYDLLYPIQTYDI